MNAGALGMITVLAVTAGVAGYLVGTLARSIRHEKKTNMRLWKNFGLSLGFCVLFFVSWVGQGIAEWHVYTDEQRDHGAPVESGDFTSQFAQSTLENWQSEFLQLFSFTVMAAVLVHKGSAESRDSDDLVMSALKRIEDHLGTEPTLRTDPVRNDRTLHVLPDGFMGWMLRSGASPEPEGYFDSRDEAIEAGRLLSARKDVDLVVHRPDGTPQGDRSEG